MPKDQGNGAGGKDRNGKALKTLAATQQEKDEALAAKKDLADNLQYAEPLLEKATTEIEVKNTKIMALEAHLEISKDKIQNLTQQLDRTREEVDIITEESKHD